MFAVLQARELSDLPILQTETLYALNSFLLSPEVLTLLLQVVQRNGVIQAGATAN